MDLLQKIDILIQDEISGATVTGNVAVNTARGNIDVIGGSCPKGQIYDKIKKICVPSKKNETSVVGGSYVGGTTTNIIGSGQTRVWGNKQGAMPELNRKNPVEGEMDDKTKENMNRKSLKFNKLTGAYTPSLWGENG
jgi:hypothetical protein